MKYYHQQPKEQRRFKNTAVYAAPAAYGEKVDIEKALEKCREYVKHSRGLKLVRIYRDEKVEIIRGKEEGSQRETLGVKGNEAWNRLLFDTETSAVEVVVIYAARTVAPTVYALDNMVSNYFLPCGIRFIDVEAEFDTAEGEAEGYLKKRRGEYRRTVKHKPHKSHKNKSGKEGV